MAQLRMVRQHDAAVGMGEHGAGDIGLASLSFLIPAGALLIAGWAVLKPHNRRAWPLIAGAVLLLIGIITLWFYPNGKAS